MSLASKTGAALAGLLYAAGAAWAGPTVGGPSAAPGTGTEFSSMPGAGGLVLKLTLSLAAVVALILLLQRLARRWGGSFGRGGSGERIQVVSTRALGPRTSLALIQVMGRTLLVSISPQGIRPVADLGEVPAVRPEEPAETGKRSLFRVERPQPPVKSAAFEGELSRRLAALRERYQTVAETQAQCEGGNR
jgi:flagellar protein FliO/FliZ